MEYLYLIIELLLFIPAAYWAGKLLEKFKIPKLITYLVMGIIVGNIYTAMPMNLHISDNVKEISKLALSVVLFKAGLGISVKTLKKVGFRAGLLGTLPNLAEGFAVAGLAMAFLKFNFMEAGLLGFALNAVSPAVVIPTMSKIQDEGYGNKSGITTMNLASASIDDVVSLTLFSIFLGLSVGNNSGALGNYKELVIVITGIAIALIVGYIFVKLYGKTNKWLQLAMAAAIILVVYVYEIAFHDHMYVSLTMFVMVLGFTIANIRPELKANLSKYTSKVWNIAQIALFFTVGSAVIFTKAFGTHTGWGILIILIGLSARLIISYLCLIGSTFNNKQRLFNVFANIPKATVQATVGAIPLAYGMASGDIILGIAVLGILITAPIGLLLLEKTYKKFLEKDTKSNEIKK